MIASARCLLLKTALAEKRACHASLVRMLNKGMQGVVRHVGAEGDGFRTAGIGTVAAAAAVVDASVTVGVAARAKLTLVGESMELVAVVVGSLEGQ
jgi:hypothetical protein